MFAVPDEVRLSDKASANATQAKQPNENAAAKAKTDNRPVSVQMNELISVEPMGDQTLAQAWDQYFAELKLADERTRAIHDARLRLTVRQGLLRAKNADEAGDSDKTKIEFQQICDMIGAALRQGHAQAWMYHGLALALEGSGAPQSEVERAMLSAVDFAESTDDLLNVARHLNQMEMPERAIRLCKDAAKLDPYKSEAYLMALGIARQIDDLSGGSLGHVPVSCVKLGLNRCNRLKTRQDLPPARLINDCLKKDVCWKQSNSNPTIRKL
jgi:tetratricopeptide (TPR) repeat protein